MADNICRQKTGDKESGVSTDMSTDMDARTKSLAEARCLIFKIGSAVLTNENGLDAEILDSLAAQMAQILKAGPKGRRLLVVSSAAVAAGRSVLRAHGVEYDTAGLAARQGAAAIGQGKLMRAWDDAFRKQELATAQVLLTQDDFRVRQRLFNARNTFTEILSWGAVPIVNENDTVSTEGLKFGDNDSLASLLASLVGADLVINLTSAPGVFARPPKEGEAPEILSCIEDVAGLDLDAMCGGKTTVGTGGMYSKLLSARRCAQRGVPTLIVPGKEKDVLQRAFAGEPIGTYVCPSEKAIPMRKFWLAYKTSPVGVLHVDDGAAVALREKGKSLLPGGIREVEGSFEKGDLVRIVANGKSLGVGVTNYTSGDIARIKGLKRIEVAAALGDAHYKEVIHRDNMLLDAAI